METVEVLVRIPKKLLDETKAIWNSMFGSTMLNDTEIAIATGTVLPKGHGALKDVDKIVIESSVDMWTDNGYEPMIAVEAINNSPTVIEADKDGE